MKFGTKDRIVYYSLWTTSYQMKNASKVAGKYYYYT